MQARAERHLNQPKELLIVSPILSLVSIILIDRSLLVLATNPVELETGVL